MAAEKLKVELQDENGNIYYLHTDASIVFCDDGTSVAAKLSNKMDTAKIINNGLTTEPGFALDARYGRTLQNQITQVNSDLKNRTVDETYQIPDINGVSTHPEYIDIGFHKVTRYSNGTRIYSAQVYIHTSSISNSTIGYIDPEFMGIAQDLYGYAVDVNTDRIFLVQILPNGTIMIKTLGGLAIPEPMLRIRCNIVY